MSTLEEKASTRSKLVLEFEYRIQTCHSLTYGILLLGYDTKTK